MKPKLRCRVQELPALASRYRYPLQDVELRAMATSIGARGSLTKEELRAVARWKAPRSARRMETNSEEYVAEITGCAFRANTERGRIEMLTLLDGVKWPTASVILHFFHKEPYPILDFRALWTISVEVPNEYSFDFWWEYVKFCRNLAKQAGLDMRTLDKALWQYSKETQAPV